MHGETVKNILENSQIQNFMKIRRGGATLFHAERRKSRRTERRTGRRKDRQDEANSSFSQFCEPA